MRQVNALINFVASLRGFTEEKEGEKKRGISVLEHKPNTFLNNFLKTLLYEENSKLDHFCFISHVEAVSSSPQSCGDFCEISYSVYMLGFNR